MPTAPDQTPGAGPAAWVLRGVRLVFSGLFTALGAVDRPAPHGRWWRFGAVFGWLLAVITAATSIPLYDRVLLSVAGAFALGIAVAVPLALAPYRPLIAWRLAWLMLIVAGLVVDVFPDQPWPWHPVQLLAYPVLLWRAAVRVSRSAIAWLWVLTVYVVVPFVDPANGAVILVFLTVVLLLADQVRRRREIQRGLAEEEQRTAVEAGRRALLEERARIARELHDVVAHHMSLVAVRAETAPYRLGDLPEPARDEFAGIATTARDALTEMRRLLGVLRSEVPELAFAPQPGLADVAELVSAARDAGVAVELALAVDAAAVPAGVQLSAYRIVQEALSNATRHAPGAPVRVGVDAAGGAITVNVTNGPGLEPAADPGQGGHGIRGMRERAAMFGGELRAGPDGAGGFHVTATLPLNGGT